jgi:hypothetical protein
LAPLVRALEALRGVSMIASKAHGPTGIHPRIGRVKLCKLEQAPPKVREIAWKAQARLTSRYWALCARGKKPTVVCTAIARELAGFKWAVGREMQSAQRNHAHGAKLAYRRGRSRRQGNSRLSYGPATPTPAIRQGTSRTNTRTCGSQPAHQSLITDVLQAPPPPVCDGMVRSPERTVQRALAGSQRTSELMQTARQQPSRGRWRD